MGKNCGCTSKRNIYKENPRPCPVISNPSTQNRADNRSQNNSHAKNRSRGPSLLFRKAFYYNCLRNRQNTTTAKTLQNSGKNHKLNIFCHAAQHRSNSEHQNTYDKKVFPPKYFTKKINSRNNNPGSNKITCQNPH